MQEGPYTILPEVDAWDKMRDARYYAGPFPVVAHPPCERWGRYWAGGPNVGIRKIKGDDNGCFEAALAAVKKYGGVLEHPADSHAWSAFGLNAPPYEGGWTQADFEGGWTCRVEQGHYGHRARKPTWLYANGVILHELKWGKCEGRECIEESFRSSEARRIARAAGIKPRKRLNAKDRLGTPLPFRDLLISLAISAKVSI